jgi:hypothetical protein
LLYCKFSDDGGYTKHTLELLYCKFSDDGGYTETCRSCCIVNFLMMVVTPKHVGVVVL